MMDWFPLLKPPDVPFRGEWTKPKAIALQPGMWRRVLNLRADEFALYVRDGISELTPSPVDASAVFLGGAALSPNGKQFLLAAYAVSGATRIYAVNTAADTPFPGAKGSFHELTQESGPYGNTRFASTSAKVHFTLVTSQRNQRDYVVAGNGVDLPRVWNGFVQALPFTGHHFIIHDNIAWFNEDSSAFRVVAEWGVTSGQFFPMSGSVMPTHSNSGGGISGANVGTAPDNNPRLTVHPSVAPGDWAKLEFADQKSFREKQVAILWSSTLSSFWDWVKLEWSMNNVAWTTVHDGSLVGATKVQQVIDDTGKYIVTAFPVDGLAIRSEIRFLRITWMGPYKPPAAFTVDLYAFTSTGNAPGGCQHGLSLVNSASNAESYGKVLPPATTHRFDLIGSRPLPVKVPFNEEFWYTYRIYFQNPSTAERDKGVNYVRVYRRDPGETFFTAVEPVMGIEFIIAVFSLEQWVFRSGEAGSVVSVFDNQPGTKKNPLLRLPSGFHRTIPRAFASISAANRLIVGDVTDLDQRRLADVWISEAGNPFRFSSLIGPAQLLSGLPDLAGPTRFSLFGEHVTAFAKSATSVLGSESIFVFTARSLFSLEGGDSIRMSNPRLIGPHGTISPRSVVAYEGFIYWVDDDRQLRRLGGGELSRLSAGRVEDQLRACPAIRDVAGVMFRDIFRLAHRPPGATANTRAMLYDTRTGVFMRDEPGSPCTLEQFAVMEEDAELKLFAFASNGKVYQLEDPAAAGDLGSTVAIGLDTGEFTSGGEDDLHVGPARVLVDAGTGQLTVTRIGVMAGSPAGAVGTIDLSSAGARKHAQDLGPGDLIPGMTDVAIMVSVAGALPSGATLYELSLMGSARFRGYGSG